MFRVNDLVSYGTTGICRVEAVEHPDMPGIDQERLYYRLSPLRQNGVIYLPQESAESKMRPVITKQEAERLIDRIPSVRVHPVESARPQELSGKYQQVIRQQDCESLMELIVLLYSKKQTAQQTKRHFSRIDESYMKRAKELLHEELGVALGIPLEEVEGYIVARVEQIEAESLRS